MTECAVSVRHLGKKFLLAGKRPVTLREAIDRRIFAAWRSRDAGIQADPRTLWALKDVSFDIARGEVVGLIGPNGAGKTVLLRILCGITKPTEGVAEIRGRIGALLELGTGFHPELSGRDNIYLNASLLGLRRHEIDEKLEEIVEFSGIQYAIDEPVKHYSSGMTVRLAFSIAVNLDPEILLLDEVWAVGDSDFQTKALAKMQQLIAGNRTVVFVSHSMALVATACTRCILLEQGRLRMQGAPDVVIREYLSPAQRVSLGALKVDPVDSGAGGDRTTHQPTSESQALRTESNSLVAESDSLIHERHTLRSERNSLLAERDSLIHQRDALLSERDSLIHERDGTNTPPLGAGENRNFYIIFSLPKSGSQALAASLDQGFIPSPFGTRWPVSMNFPSGLHIELPIRHDILKFFPAGGWLHTHAGASFPSVDVLGRNGIKYLIVIRHPLDQVASYYCHVRKHSDLPAEVPGHPGHRYCVPMAKLELRYFKPGADVDDGVCHLIESGYLYSVLKWITDWCTYRHQSLSMIVRYEDFVDRVVDCLQRIAAFMPSALRFGDTEIGKAVAEMERYRIQSINARETDYPRGWTGKIGVRNTYFSKDNEEAAKKVVDGFLRSYNGAAQLEQLYPDLRRCGES